MSNEMGAPKPKSPAKPRTPLTVSDQGEAGGYAAVTDRAKGKSRTFLRSLGILILILVLLAVAMVIWIIIRMQSGDIPIPGFFKNSIPIPHITNPVDKVF